MQFRRNDKLEEEHYSIYKCATVCSSSTLVVVKLVVDLVLRVV